VHQGTARDALLFALGSNTTHGLRRTPADKRRAVEVMLRDEEWAKWSDREIARLCDLSHAFVSGVRRELGELGLKLETRVVRRGESLYEMRPRAPREEASAFDWAALDVETRQALERSLGEIKGSLEYANSVLGEVGEKVLVMRQHLSAAQFASLLKAEFAWRVDDAGVFTIGVTWTAKEENYRD
jgi:hypothetical protein